MCGTLICISFRSLHCKENIKKLTGKTRNKRILKKSKWYAID